MNALGQRPDAKGPTVLQGLLRADTWISALSQRLKVMTLYSPFGRGAVETIPLNRTGGTLGVLDSPQARLAIPLLDRASASALERALLQESALVVTHFRYANAHRQHLRCKRDDMDSSSILREQSDSLRHIDRLLFQPLILN